MATAGGSADFVMMKRQLILPRTGLGVAALLLELAGPAARAQAPTAFPDLGLYPNPAHIRATVEVPAVAGGYPRHHYAD